MNLLFLRGQVPQDRNPQEIVFDTIEEVDDMWTQLFFNMISENDYGELWYWNGDREKKFSSNFTERWVSSFAYHLPDFVPDVIFCRGGFPEYHPILKQFPNAISIYYGAGARFLPLTSYIDYDIILQDSKEQLKISEKRFPKSLSTLFIKPAAENIFYPHDVEKEYDVCFPANGSQNFKGHDFIYSTAPKDLKILNLGNPSKISKPDNVTSYRVLRSNMAENISKCKVGIVAVNNDRDSCPRVVPELLACNLPVIALNDIRFWKEKYCVRDVSGELTIKDGFWRTVRHVLDNINLYRPKNYYDKELSLKKAAEFILNKIKEVKQGL